MHGAFQTIPVDLHLVPPTNRSWAVMHSRSYAHQLFSIWLAQLGHMHKSSSSSTIFTSVILIFMLSGVFLFLQNIVKCRACGMQVMVACEPVDNVLAILLQTNDDLLAAVNRWDTTASRLVMLQSRLAAATSAPSQQPRSSRRAASPALSGSSSTNSASDLTPTTAASGGVFWSRLEVEPPRQNPPSSLHQQQVHQQHQRPQAESSHGSHPSLLDSSFAQRQEGAAAAGANPQRRGSSKMLSSSSYATRQQQQTHQQQSTLHDQNPDDASWHAFGAGASMPAAPSAGSMHSQGGGEASNRAEGLQEFRGTVLNYRPAAPQHTDGADQQSPVVEDGSDEAHSQELQAWPQAVAEAEPSRNAGADFGQQPLDPFAVSSIDGWRHATDEHGANSATSSAFDAFSSDPYPTQPPAAVLQTTSASSTGQHSSAQQDQDSSFSSSYSAVGMDLPQAPQPLAGAQSDSALGSRKPSLSLSTGTRGPSLPSPHNLSTNSLSSLASGPAAATTSRGSASEQGVSRAGGNEGTDAEIQKLRGQLHQMAAQHEEALRKMNADHEVDVATIQAQAVAKMRELIEKVKEQTVKEREQAELRLQEAHQAEQNALAHLHSLRQDCRDKDALIAELRRKLDQASSSSAPAKEQSHNHEAERPGSAGELGATSQGLNLAGLQDSPFGGVPRPKSAATSQQLPTVAPKGRKGRMLRAGSHLDKGAASLNSLQAYYRQPALRVRFTPGQLEELSNGVPGPSHKEWAATLKLPGAQNAAD
ncbi:hypothetical protein ABBQ32_010132 [Trebouxia sp. C0010 RCD-2024]